MTSISLQRFFHVLLAAMLLIPAGASAQVRSITVYSEFAAPVTKRIGVQHISGVGGGVDVAFTLAGRMSLGIRGGYTLFSLDQPDQLNQWNWNFWNDRYLNKIQSDMRADPSLSAVIGSIQKMDFIPVAVHLDYAFVPAERFAITPSVSGGVSWYTRRLYADETWTKQFSAAGYSFTYNFRNFAPPKKGNAFHAGIGCTVQYRVFSDVNISAAGFYTQYLSTINKNGYAAFPFENEMNVRLGLDFLY